MKERRKEGILQEWTEESMEGRMDRRKQGKKVKKKKR